MLYDFKAIKKAQYVMYAATGVLDQIDKNKRILWILGDVCLSSFLSVMAMKVGVT